MVKSELVVSNPRRTNEVGRPVEVESLQDLAQYNWDLLIKIVTPKNLRRLAARKFILDEVIGFRAEDDGDSSEVQHEVLVDVTNLNSQKAVRISVQEQSSLLAPDRIRVRWDIEHRLDSCPIQNLIETPFDNSLGDWDYNKRIPIISDGKFQLDSYEEKWKCLQRYRWVLSSIRQQLK